MSKCSLFLLGISASAIVYWCQSIQKLLDRIQSLSVCSLLGLNRKTSFSPVQRVYSCTEETAESCAGCTVRCTGNQHQDQVSQAVVEGTRSSEEWSVVSAGDPVLIFIIGDIVMSVWLGILITQWGMWWGQTPGHCHGHPWWHDGHGGRVLDPWH